MSNYSRIIPREILERNNKIEENKERIHNAHEHAKRCHNIKAMRKIKLMDVDKKTGKIYTKRERRKTVYNTTVLKRRGYHKLAEAIENE